VITGASSGIGLASARAFADEGAEVALLARGEEGLDRAARLVEQRGGKAHVLPVDVADRPALGEAIDEAASRMGGFDVLVSNAAAMLFGDFREVEPEDFDRVTAVTYTGAVNAIRFALPHLERSAGTVVVVGSANAKAPLPTFTGYAAAKHALRGLVGGLRIELRAAGSLARVTMVHPGPVDTPLWRQVTTVSGFLPRTPPLSYSADRVAGAVVEAALNPAKAERDVGPESWALGTLYDHARPVADALLSGVRWWYRGGRIPAQSAGSLRHAVGTGETSGGLLGRDLTGLLGIARLPIALVRGRDPEADVMGIEATRAATPDNR